MVAARNMEKLQAMAASLPNAVAIQADMRKPEDIKSLIDQTRAEIRPG